MSSKASSAARRTVRRARPAQLMEHRTHQFTRYLAGRLCAASGQGRGCIQDARGPLLVVTR